MSQVSAEWGERVRAANDTLRDENDRLRADLADALQRAEKAERDALQAFEDHQGVCQVVFQLRQDLAAARRERDGLETVARGLEKDLRNAQLPWFAERLAEALEKASG